MKKLKLRKSVKNVMLVILEMFIYFMVSDFGYMASNNNLGLCLIGLGWVTIIFIIPFTIYNLNTEE